MNRIGFLLGLCLTVHCVLAKEQVAQKALRVPENAGQADNGLQLEIDVPESWYVLGDSIQVPLHFKNTNSSTQCVLIDRCCSFYDRVYMIDEQGILCSASHERSRAKHLGATWIDIPANGHTSIPQALTHWVVIKKPGTYTLWFEYDLKKIDPKDQENGGRKHGNMPWNGSLASNAVKITILSQGDYAQRAAGMLKTPPLDGFSLSLSTKSSVCRLGESPQLVVELKNTETHPLSISWAANYRVSRLSPDGTAISVQEYVYRTAKDPVPLVELPAGEQHAIELKLCDDHVQKALAGKVLYRVDFWLPAPIEINTDLPVPPVRITSNEVEITFEMHPADMDRLLPLAAGEVQRRERGRQARNLNVLTSYLEQIGPWLSARIKDRATPEQQLAADLEIAYKLKLAARLLPRYDPSYGIRIDARGARLEPAAFAELGQLAQPVSDPVEFAKRLVRLRACADMAREHITLKVFIAPETPAAACQTLAREVTREAVARNVYIYRLEIFTEAMKHQLSFQEDGSYSLMIGVGTVNGNLRYSVQIQPNRDPRPNYYSGWDTKDLPAAVADLVSSPYQFDNAASLANFLATREKRHEQIWILPSGNVTWNDVNDALSAVQSWLPDTSPSIAMSVPASPKNAPRVVAPVPQPLPAKNDDF